MREYFQMAPGDLTQCPECAGKMTRSSIQPSKAVREDLDDKDSCLMAVHNYSLLFVCDACQWWYVRENWDYAENGTTLDYIIVGRRSSRDLNAKTTILVESESPWLNALANSSIYYHSTPFPEEVALLFPGGMRVKTVKFHNDPIFKSLFLKLLRALNRMSC
jgi:hypothetical protein